jgi:hypothetical protein
MVVVVAAAALVARPLRRRCHRDSIRRQAAIVVVCDLQFLMSFSSENPLFSS